MPSCFGVHFVIMLIFTSAKEVMFSSLFVCLSVCLLAALCKNFQMDLHEIFRESWQWANEEMIKFWWRSGSQIRVCIRIRRSGYGYGSGPYRDTVKVGLGGGVHCPSASS